MIAIGAGGLDVAVAMAGGHFNVTCPKVVKIELKGRLRPWVSAKDVILKVLETFTTHGNVGTVFEYGGEGVATLTVPERATITNMGAECGVTTSVFPSDDVTRQFLVAQDRGDQWVALSADPDAEYDRVVEVDLSTLEPLASAPHSPGNIMTVADANEMAVDQVCMGSCTNSSYRDMMIFAELLKDRTIHPNVSAVVGPGSKQVVEMLSANGRLAYILGAGVRMAENACGFCIGNSQSPKTEAISLRTSNRNFLGRSGTKSANSYLVSPETAAAGAITGKFIDPRKLEEMGIDYPQVETPDGFIVNDNMIMPPVDDPGDVEIYRGPNIGDPPKNAPLSEIISGEVVIKVGDEITTDHIIPAGSKMKYRSNVPKYSEFLFEVVDDTFFERAKGIRDSGNDNVIIAGISYGQGSSREHAALCPMYMGVKAVITKGMERIHKANLVNFGIVPLDFDDPADYDGIDQGDSLEIPNVRSALEGAGSTMTVKNMTKGTEFEATFDLSEKDKEKILAGGTLNLIAQQMR
jgi:aconitate hydratase